MATGDDAALTRASVEFQTNDEDKDDDTLVEVAVHLQDGTVVATTTFGEDWQNFGHFDDHSHSGPFDLLLEQPATRGQLKTGSVSVAIQPNGNDTWRFNFLVDMLFEDGGHLLARANGLELTEDTGRKQQQFGIE